MSGLQGPLLQTCPCLPAPSRITPECRRLSHAQFSTCCLWNPGTAELRHCLIFSAAVSPSPREHQYSAQPLSCTCTMSITEDLLLSFSGCSTLAEIEDIVLRDQGLTSIQAGAECPPSQMQHKFSLSFIAGSTALSATSDSVTGPQCIVAC